MLMGEGTGTVGGVTVVMTFSWVLISWKAANVCGWSWGNLMSPLY